MKNIVIGITGGIGSGKSTVSRLLENNGFQILIADSIAREVMLNDKSVISKIIKVFGKDCYTQGVLNSNILANKVFNHPEQIKKLNSIVHPPTIEIIEEKIDLLKENQSITFVESALIFEAKMEDLFDYILLVTAEEDTRIKRILERDVETASEIKSRMLTQIPEDKKKGRSDFVIENNSSKEILEEKVVFFLNLFKSLAL